MYRLAITRDFVAQHYLTGGDWGAENQRHSHHYRVEVLIRGGELDRHGYVVDIVEVERVLNGVIAEVRDRTLNELEVFQDLNPSLERFARFIWTRLSGASVLSGRGLGVKLWENATDWAAYGEE